VNNQGKSVQILDNVRLYKQTKSPYWWVSVSLNNKQHRFSTKVKLVDDVAGGAAARNKAVEIATELKFKIEHGIDVSGKPSFSALCDDVVRGLDARPTQKGIYSDYKSVISNYLKPFFKRTVITDVGRPEIYKFYQEREKNTGTQISLTQKRVTNKAFSMVFDLACDLGHIKQSDIPQLPTVSSKPTRSKDYFTNDELSMVLGGFTPFIESSRNRKTREIRALLKYYTHFLAGTGARPGEEVVNLKFSNIKHEQLKGAFTWTAFIDKGKVSGRTGGRKIILASRAIDALEHVISLNDTFAGMTLRQVVDKFPHKLIFEASYRASVPEFAKPFDQYMKYLAIKDKKHTLYSFRHTYITHALLREDGMPKRAIAKQCGTSEEMIEQYYDHVITTDYAAELKKSDGLPSLSGNLAVWMDN
jgi:integrase